MYSDFAPARTTRTGRGNASVLGRRKGLRYTLTRHSFCGSADSAA